MLKGFFLFCRGFFPKKELFQTKTRVDMSIYCNFEAKRKDIYLYNNHT